jgi:hypothetical protein
MSSCEHRHRRSRHDRDHCERDRLRPGVESTRLHRVAPLQQQIDDRWCVETGVSALLSSETVFFAIDDHGQFVETPDCRG